MPCFRCYSDKRGKSIDKYRRHSQYSIVCEQEFPREIRRRNALNIQLQMQILSELSENTYGLAVDGKENQPYEAKDFFVFKEILGSGAMGVVFRAYFKPTGEVFAVKFVPHFRNCKTMVLRELSILQLSSKCMWLVHYHSHFRVGDNMYFVVEICEGGTLADVIGNKLLMPPRLGRVYLKELCNAIFFLHGIKVVHRDIAPENLLLNSQAHLRLADFNLCRTIEEPNGERMTNCGKPAIRAPEMYLDKPCTFAVDWWSVGILLYRFTSGSFPFRTDKLTHGYQSVTKLQEKYPEWLFTDPGARNFCQRLLQKNPKQRLGFTNEISSIKSHPYFFGVDWSGEDNIEHIIDLDMKAQTLEQYTHVCKHVLRILGKDIQKPNADRGDRDESNVAQAGYWYVKSLLTAGSLESSTNSRREAKLSPETSV